MKLTIITCTYNSASTIAKCIDSVFLQWFDDVDYEHIFVDANSTDTTLDIIHHKYATKSNYRIISSDPKWAYNAMNLWISHARWTYLYLLNSDDSIYQTWLSWLISHAANNQSDFCFWNARYVDAQNNLLHTLTPKKFLPFFLKKKLCRYILFFLHYSCPQATVYKKHLHEAVWSYNEIYKFLADRDFSIKVASGDYLTHYVDIDVCDFFVHTWSLTSNHNNRKKMNQEATSIINHHFGYGLWNRRTSLVTWVKRILWFFSW